MGRTSVGRGADGRTLQGSSSESDTPDRAVRVSQQLVAALESLVVPVVVLGPPPHRPSYIAGGPLGTAAMAVVGLALAAAISASTRSTRGSSTSLIWLISGTLLILAGAAAFTDFGGVALIWSAVMSLAATLSTVRWARSLGGRALTFSWLLALAALLGVYADGFAPAVGVTGPALSPSATNLLAVLPGLAWLVAVVLTMSAVIRRSERSASV